jgi:hypothetical protein
VLAFPLKAPEDSRAHHKFLGIEPEQRISIRRRPARIPQTQSTESFHATGKGSSHGRCDADMSSFEGFFPTPRAMTTANLPWNQCLHFLVNHTRLGEILHCSRRPVQSGGSSEPPAAGAGVCSSAVPRLLILSLRSFSFRGVSPSGRVRMLSLSGTSNWNAIFHRAFSSSSHSSHAMPKIELKGRGRAPMNDMLKGM